MAVSGVVFTVSAGCLAAASEAVRAFPGVVDVQDVEGGCKLAAVLECPSQDLQKNLEALAASAHVLSLDVAYINYEEDMDAQGRIPCPSHTPKARRCGGGDGA